MSKITIIVVRHIGLPLGILFANKVMKLIFMTKIKNIIKLKLKMPLWKRVEKLLKNKSKIFATY